MAILTPFPCRDLDTPKLPPPQVEKIYKKERERKRLRDFFDEKGRKFDDPLLSFRGDALSVTTPNNWSYVLDQYCEGIYYKSAQAGFSASYIKRQMNKNKGGVLVDLIPLVQKQSAFALLKFMKESVDAYIFLQLVV